MKTGEEKTINLTFPEDYARQELRARKTYFKVKLNEIREKNLPELNDEFAKSLGNHTSLDELKEKTRAELTKYKEGSINFKLKQDIASEIIKLNEFEVPECIVFEQKKRLVDEARMRLATIGKENINNYINEHDHEFFEQAKSNVKLFFLFEEIAKIENIVINEPEINKELETIAQKSPDSIEKIREYYKKQNLFEDLKYRIKEEKIYNLIKESSSIEEKNPEAESED